MMKRIFEFTILCLFIVSCSSVQIQYSQQSVPEEGSSQFVKYTDDNDNIIGPRIISTYEGVLNWYAPACIALSNDGEKLAYVATSSNFNNLYIRNVKGGKSVVQRTFNKNVLDMNFSPNDEDIVFASSNRAFIPTANGAIMTYNVRPSLHVIKTEGGASIQQIADGVGGQYSPDGNTVYYSMTENDFYTGTVWSINLETSLKTQYANGFTPQVSSDGNHFLVTRNSTDGENRGEIWMIDVKNGKETLILGRPDMGFSTPQLSSNGKTIVCVGSTLQQENIPANLDIYTVKIDGTGLKQLTFHPGHDVSPRWSPDGESIFFISQRGTDKGCYNIWKMSFNLNE